MAVPIGAGMSLGDVKTNVETADPSIVINSLQDAIDNVHYFDFDSNYYTFPPTSLAEFQGYNYVLDTTAPTAPTNLLAKFITNTTFTLSWTASTDNEGVFYYDIYKDGSFLQQVDGTVLSYNAQYLTAGSSHNWKVIAYDESGNNTASSILTVVMGRTVYATTMTTLGRSTWNQAVTDPVNYTRYVTASNGIITNGAVIYNNSNGTNPLNGGGNYFYNGSAYFNVSSSGVVSGKTTYAP